MQKLKSELEIANGLKFLKMKCSSSTLFTLTLLSLIFFIKRSSPDSVHQGPREWCYSKKECGPESDKWTGVCHTGIHQSPVNLVGCDGQEPIRAHVSLRLEHLKADHFFMQNNGHTVNMDFRDYGEGSYIFPSYDVPFTSDYENFLHIKESCATQLQLTGYKFTNAHFHWGKSDNEGSEHTMDGKAYAMELHLVHHNELYPNIQQAVASGDPNALAVVAIFLQVSNLTIPNRTLAPILKNIQEIQEPSTDRCWMKVDEPLDLSQIVPKPNARLYFYKGSLTSPGCNEQVNWYIFEKPVLISHSDAEAFRRLYDWDGNRFSQNHRPVQPANGRKIYLLQLD